MQAKNHATISLTISHFEMACHSTAEHFSISFAVARDLAMIEHKQDLRARQTLQCKTVIEMQKEVLNTKGNIRLQYRSLCPTVSGPRANIQKKGLYHRPSS